MQLSVKVAVYLHVHKDYITYDPATDGMYELSSTPVGCVCSCENSAAICLLNYVISISPRVSTALRWQVIPLLTFRSDSTEIFQRYTV